MKRKRQRYQFSVSHHELQKHFIPAVNPFKYLGGQGAPIGYNAGTKRIKPSAGPIPGPTPPPRPVPPRPKPSGGGGGGRPSESSQFLDNLKTGAEFTLGAAALHQVGKGVVYAGQKGYQAAANYLATSSAPAAGSLEMTTVRNLSNGLQEVTYAPRAAFSGEGLAASAAEGAEALQAAEAAASAARAAEVGGGLWGWLTRAFGGSAEAEAAANAAEATAIGAIEEAAPLLLAA
jgi:hypothetical protein